MADFTNYLLLLLIYLIMFSARIVIFGVWLYQMKYIVQNRLDPTYPTPTVYMYVILDHQSVH